MNKCVWTHIKCGYYRTGCYTDFKTSNGTELEEDHVYCQFCGKPIETIQINRSSDRSEEILRRFV